MAQDRIHKILKEFESRGIPARTGKSTRTFRLTEPQVSKFMSYCNWKGWVASEVIDKFIQEFLEAASGDMPSDEVLAEHRIKRKTAP